MKNKTFDVITFGNAIVDIINPTEYDFLKKNSLVPGSMNLVSQDEAKNLLLQCEPKEIISGGSAANTAVGIASFGGNPAFIGKVKNDKFGKIFADSLNSSGVTFKSLKSSEGPPTATSLISVTPDGERTMCTYLGACLELAEHDIDEKIIIDSKICYVEGYLWDPPEAKKALRKAINICKKNNILVAFTLSDSFCVNRFRGEFIELIKNDIDILFCNEDEIKSLYECDLESAKYKVEEMGKETVITLGSNGSTVFRNNKWTNVEAYKPKTVIDTTGAGDLFAAGYLHGTCLNLNAENCSKIGSIVASEIISHVGPRPTQSLKSLIKDI